MDLEADEIIHKLEQWACMHGKSKSNVFCDGH